MFCLIIYRDVPTEFDDEKFVRKPTDFEFIEERSHSAAVAEAYSIIGNARGGDYIVGATLLSVSDVTTINLDDDEEPKSELEKLRGQVEEMSAKADGYDALMNAIAKFSGTDPREVEAEQPSPINPFGMPKRASNTDIAINLLHEAVRKKAEEMSK